MYFTIRNVRWCCPTLNCISVRSQVDLFYHHCYPSVDVHNMASPPFTPIDGNGSGSSPRDRHENRRTANIPSVRTPSQCRIAQSIGEDGCSSATKKICGDINPHSPPPQPGNNPARTRRRRSDRASRHRTALPSRARDPPLGPPPPTAVISSRHCTPILLDPPPPTRSPAVTSRGPNRFGTASEM